MNDVVILNLLKKTDKFLVEESTNCNGESVLDPIKLGSAKGIIQSLIEEFSGRVPLPPPAGTDS